MIVVDECGMLSHGTEIEIVLRYPHETKDAQGKPTRITVTLSCPHTSATFTHERACRNMCHLDEMRAAGCRQVHPRPSHLERKAVIAMTRMQADQGRLCRCHEGYWLIRGMQHEVAGNGVWGLVDEQPVDSRTRLALTYKAQELGGRKQYTPLRWQPHETR